MVSENFWEKEPWFFAGLIKGITALTPALINSKLTFLKIDYFEIKDQGN